MNKKQKEMKPAMRIMFNTIREAKTREQAAQAVVTYWNSASDGTVTGSAWIDYAPDRTFGKTFLEERARIMGPDGIQAEIIFVEGEQAAIKIVHDFVTGYPSVVTLTLTARFFEEE